jgi:hypothetical protein
MSATIDSPSSRYGTLRDVADLAPLLASRSWERRAEPFPHVVADDVFGRPVYDQLATDFDTLYSTHGNPYNARHDFVGISLTRGGCGSLDLFLSPAWHTLMASLFGIDDPVGWITAGAHRHWPGSRPGFPHNDIFPERLGDSTVRGEAIESDRCRPAPRRDDRVVRAVALLFYINNPEWRPGDGGTTGLYRHWSDDVDDPARLIAPRHNSLLAFECSPYSYHAFMANGRRRDSVVVFAHRSLSSFQALWGADGVRQYADPGSSRA